MLILGKPKKKKSSGKSGEPSKDESGAVNDIATSVSSIDASLMGFAGTLLKKDKKKFDEAKKAYTVQAEQLKVIKGDSKDKDTKKKWRDIVKIMSGGIKNLFKNIAGIAKSLVGKASGILGFLFALFIILKLGLLQTLIPAMLDLLTELIGGIIEELPTILRFFKKLFFETMPDVLKKIFNTVLDSFDIPEDSPLRSFLDLLADLAPTLILVGAALKAVSVAFSLFDKSLLTFLLSNPIGWIVLAVIALTVAMVALYKRAEAVSDFFDGLIERFKKMGKLGKALVILLAVIFAPISMIIALIYGLAKLFKSVKKIGWKNTFKLIKSYIIGAFKDAFAFIKTKFLDPIIKWFKDKKTSILNLFDSASAILKRMLHSIGDVLGAFLDHIVFALPKDITGVDRKGAKTYEEFRVLQYGQKLQGDKEERESISKYAKAVASGKQAEIEASGAGLTADEKAMAMAYLADKGKGNETIETYLKKLVDIRDQNTRNITVTKFFTDSESRTGKI